MTGERQPARHPRPLRHARWHARFTNLLMSKRDGTIVLDPHAIDAYVITLDQDGAAVRDTLIEWLG